jgi:hypothetical protein
MSFLRITSLFLVAAGAVSAQGHAASVPNSPLPLGATIPIVFTKTINAAHAKPGDPVTARTMQNIRLTDGREVPSGATVTGHVLAAKAFKYDNTPYTKQSAGSLDIQIDGLLVGGVQVPLSASVRAMADPFESEHAYEPKSTDLDPLGTTTQVGGDLLTPSQKEIVNRDGDVVGYNKKDGPYAHLIANTRGSMYCNGGDTEQPMFRFSASACGLYGFTGQSLTDSPASRIGLSSTHYTPEIAKHSTALLEVLQDNGQSK